MFIDGEPKTPVLRARTRGNQQIQAGKAVDLADGSHAQAS